jgi:hypothetical protein
MRTLFSMLPLAISVTPKATMKTTFLVMKLCTTTKQPKNVRVCTHFKCIWFQIADDRKSISIKKDDAEGDLYDAGKHASVTACFFTKCIVLEPGGASGRRSVDSGSPVSK